MANFAITKNKFVLPFTDTTKNLTVQGCGEVETYYTLGVKDVFVGNNPSTIFLLKNYTGATIKNIHIKNVFYKSGGATTIGDFFNIKLNGIQLSGTTNNIIDVSSVSDGTSIPSISIYSKVLIYEESVKEIQFSYAIEDINGFITSYTNTKIVLNIVRCTTPSNPVISNESTATDHACSLFTPTTHYLTVTVPEGEKLYIRYKSAVLSPGTFNGFIRRLTVPGQDPTIGANPYSLISGMVPTVGYKYVTYNPVQLYSPIFNPPWNIVHLQIYICLNVMYGANAALDNIQSVTVEILNSMGTVVHTIILNETRPPA